MYDYRQISFTLKVRPKFTHADQLASKIGITREQVITCSPVMTYFVYVYIINIIQNMSLPPDVKCHYGVHIHRTYIYVSLNFLGLQPLDKVATTVNKTEFANV